MPATEPPSGAIEAPAPEGADAAWVRLTVPQTPDELGRCLDNPELLLRLNPYYRFRALRPTGKGSLRAEFRNESNDQDLLVEVAFETAPNGSLTLRYDRGLKDRTVFSFAPGTSGSVLTVTEYYDRLPPGERAARLDEVDRSLTAWGAALQSYFRRLKRWSWLPGWRWYIHGPWLRMNPMARRVVWLLWVISLAEFAFFLLVLLIYVLEH